MDRPNIPFTLASRANRGKQESIVTPRHSDRSCSRRQFLKLASVAALTSTWAASSGRAADPPPFDPPKKFPLKFNPETKSYDFETSQMSGSLRVDGSYHGVNRLTDKHTGRQVIDPRYSALNLFRLFSINQAMGMPRVMERTFKAGIHAIEIHWPATDRHLGEITARYEVTELNAIDLTVTVHSSGSYAGYEIFLSNYFDKILKPRVYLKPRPRGGKSGAPQLVVPKFNDVFRDTVLVFPRDAHAARRCVDGRWDRSEFGAPTVQMVPARYYGHCLAFLTDPDNQLGVVLMARPEDCYAISTRYFADDPKDRMTSYSAFDFSLFGNNLLPGVERSVRIRLALTPLDDKLSQPLDLYRNYIGEKPDVQK
ncbi:MAG: hypothetical protein ACKVJX_11550 [Verrucomicrobiia bacterium]